ncbi:MAG: LapA family protein [Casimicrobiaceae bacterium]
MQVRTLLLVLLLAAVAIFTALNWSTFVAPTDLSLGFIVVRAPLGLIMLALLVLLLALFLIFVVYLQTSVLLDSRRHARELRTQRELADQAEASRFTELRTWLDAEFGKLAARQDDPSARVIARLEQSEDELRAAIEQAANSLAAYIGELEDRLERQRTTQGP